ncbi:MAG: amidohydrolase family protein [Chloroflexota bacterium]
MIFIPHVFPPRLSRERERYVAADPAFALLYTHPKARLATADELVASMDEAGIELSVMVNIGWSRHEMCVETNDYILEAVTRYPGRLAGFGAVQPLAGEAAVAEIERCARAGMKGVGELRPDVQGFDLADRRLMAPLAAVMEQYHLILLTHASEPVGHQYPGKGSLTPAVIYPFITAFPGLTVVCAHWGGGLPFYALMPEVKRALANTYFDTAASPFLYRPQVYHQVVQLVGADRVLFGSDYPLLAPGRLLKEIDSLDLPRETRDQILSGNARRLLGVAGRSGAG